MSHPTQPEEAPMIARGNARTERSAQRGAPAVVNLASAKQARDRTRYAALVMKVWDDMEHADRRVFLDRKAEVQIAARERL